MSRSTGSASRSENGPVIRPATIGDAAGCRDVYAPYVRETVSYTHLTLPTKRIV